MNKQRESSIFIVPRASSEWKGNEAGWITASGWAAAGEELWGHALVATTDGVFKPEESRLFPRQTDASSSNFAFSLSESKGFSAIKKNVRKVVPEVLITALKDLKLKMSKPTVWPIEKEESLQNKSIKIIWQRHDLFPGPGKKLSEKYKVPLITSVEALAVWEAEKWGVKRPFWGSYLEKRIEAHSLKASDLICCVSQEVKDKVISMGIEERKVIVTPNRVDGTLFNPEVDGSEVAEKYSLEGKKVLGWTGSFRSFHALDNIVDAFTTIHDKYPDTVLMLVGDGKEYEGVAKMVEEKGLSESVIMPGKKIFTEIPQYVANFHISLVSARTSKGFHYSPLKLREYLGAGKAVIAPNAGDLPQIFKDGKDLLLYEAGDVESLTEKILTLLDDPGLHNDLVNNAKSWFKDEGSWQHELKRVCDILNIEY